MGIVKTSYSISNYYYFGFSGMSSLVPYVAFIFYSKSWHSYCRNFLMFSHSFKTNHFSNLFEDPSFQVHHFHLTCVLLDELFQHLAQFLANSRHSRVNEWMSFSSMFSCLLTVFCTIKISLLSLLHLTFYVKDILLSPKCKFLHLRDSHFHANTKYSLFPNPDAYT